MLVTSSFPQGAHDGESDFSTWRVRCAPSDDVRGEVAPGCVTEPPDFDANGLSLPDTCYGVAQWKIGDLQQPGEGAVEFQDQENRP